jgi:peptide/nickel transport system permease protein
MDTLRGIARRLGIVVFVVLAASFMLSLLIHLLPGDPAQILVPNGTSELIKQIRHETGLDRGVFGFYFKWLGDMLHGNFGKFYLNGGYQTVASHIQKGLPVTALLILYTQIVALGIAVPLGVACAYREGKRFDRIASTILFVFSSIPGFALGLILSIILAVRLGWLDPIGYVGFFQDPVKHFKLMIMPVLSLSLGIAANYTRLLRADVIATLKEDYVTMAASKGLSNRRILWRHVFRPSSTTLLTSAALNMGALIGGTIVVETIFNIPGLGFQLAYAIGSRQIIAIQTLVALIAFAYVMFNSITDLITNIVDPRTRERRA